MQLPKLITDIIPLQLLQDKWKSILDPIISKPLNSSNILRNELLAIGANTINHLLARQMQGWMIVDQNASAEIYRSKPLNNTTLTLTSNAVVTVSILVF